MSSENEILQANIRDSFILLIAEYNKHNNLHNGYDERYKLLELIMSLESRLKSTREDSQDLSSLTNKTDKGLKTIKTLEQKIIEHVSLKYQDTTEIYNRVVEIYDNSGGVLHVVYILYYNTDRAGNYLSYTIQKGSIIERVINIADLKDQTHINYTLNAFEDYVGNIPIDNLETEIIQYIKKDICDTPIVPTPTYTKVLTKDTECSIYYDNVKCKLVVNIPIDNSEIVQYIKKDIDDTPTLPIPIYTKVFTKDIECSIYYDNIKCNLLYVFDTKNTPQLYYTFNNEKRKYIIIALKYARRQWK